MRPAVKLRVTLLLLSVALLSACSETVETPIPDQPSVYVHSMDGVPRSLDPAQASTIFSKFLVVNLYDTLYRYRYLARPYELTTNMAMGMPEFSDDGLTLTIILKPGVHFIDDPVFPDGKGREVIAADVVYSILRHFDPDMRGQGAWLWQGRLAGIDEWKAAGANYDVPPVGLQAIDRYTLQLKLTQPFPQIVHTLTQGYAAIVAREAVEAYGEELGTRPVGSGPYQLESFDSARAVLVRNPDFRDEPISLADEGFDAQRDGAWGLAAIEGKSPPLTDRVEVEFIPEDAARWNTFYSGRSHYLKASISQLDTLMTDTASAELKPELAERFFLDDAPEAGFVYTNFNMSDPDIGYHEDPDQDRRNLALRCAIRKGFDWQTRNEQFFAGTAQIFPGVIPPGVPEFDPQLDESSITFDPRGAMDLLAANGWTPENLPVLEYGFPASVTERQLFEQFRSFMEAIGFPRDKVRPKAFASFGDFAQAYSKREVMLITTGWTMDYPDAENTLQLFYGPNASPGANMANFNNEAFNELYREASILQPSPERTTLFEQMNQIVIDECAAISGLNRHLALMWSQEAIMRPDRSFLGGYFVRFVDMVPPTEP